MPNLPSGSRLFSTSKEGATKSEQCPVWEDGGFLSWCCSPWICSSRPENNKGILHRSSSVAEKYIKKKTVTPVGKWWLAPTSWQLYFPGNQQPLNG